MKTKNKHILAAMLLSLAGTTLTAQELNSAYFTDDFKYRHSMNAAYGNEQSYFSVPSLGNVNVRMMGNFGLDAVLYENKWGGKTTTTFMNPNISTSEALGNFHSGDNKLIGNVKLTILSAGFKAFGGYNTIELNSKTNFGVVLPYELFEFAKNIGNRHYDIGSVNLNAQSYAELAFGHSRDINEKLRLGAKVKVLLGLARADVEMSNITADLSGNDWDITGQAQADVMMKGFSFEEKTSDYKVRDGQYRHVDDIDVDGAGIGGIGLAVDLGGIYKINEDITVSAAVNDLGFISWSNDVMACNNAKSFKFSGFRDLGVHSGDGSFDEKTDAYGDQLADFANLQDQGDQGGTTKGIAATINVGGEYTLPMYRQLSFGLLSSTRLNGDYTWTEGRLSANYRPLNWLDGGISLAVGSLATSFGWVLNVHPKGFNFFVGMDHLMGKTAKQMIPLSSNASLTLGMNITW